MSFTFGSSNQLETTIKKNILIALGLGMALLAVAQTSGLSTNLTGPLGKGKARYKQVIKPGEVQAELQVEAENLKANDIYTITVGSSISSTQTATALGRISLKQRWNTQPLPSIPSGTEVTIMNSEGLTVLSGVMR